MTEYNTISRYNRYQTLRDLRDGHLCAWLVIKHGNSYSVLDREVAGGKQTFHDICNDGLLQTDENNRWTLTDAGAIELENLRASLNRGDL
jgi:hypothetical protein